MTLDYYEVKPDTSGLRYLIYGTTGSGKTSLAATMADDEPTRPVLIANTDYGLSSIAHRRNLVAVNINTVDDLEQLVNDIIRPEDKKPEQLRGIRTLIGDSLSELKDVVLDEMVLEAYGKDPNKRDKYIASVREYGRVTGALCRHIDTLRQTGMNLVFTAGEQVILHPVTNLPTKIQPLLNPKLLERVGHMMDFIWYVYTQNGKHYLQTISTGVELIKSRNIRFVRALEDLSIQRVRQSGVVVKDTPNRDLGELSVDDVRGRFRINPDEPILVTLHNLFLDVTRGQ